MSDKNDVVEEALGATKDELSDFDREKHLIKAVKMLGEIEESLDQKEERFKDWYSLHFPELVEEVNDIEELAKILDDSVKREDLDPFSGLAEDSKGSEIGSEEKKLLDSIVQNIESDIEIKEDIENYVESNMRDEASNLSKLLGDFLAAKVLTAAGSLEDLAKMPASTVQMLGAEKALFRYLRGEGTPPKHGILFEHEFVRPLQSNERGKMARFLANKAVMAARLDFYDGEEKGEEFREEAREKFEELKG
jgi:nucleolar protein 56